jgi:hypothetical protein
MKKVEMHIMEYNSIIETEELTFRNSTEYTSGNGITTDYDFEKYPNGWYRIWVAGYPNTTTTGRRFRLRLTDADGNLNFVGDTVSSYLYGWGLQVEFGAFPTSYIPTEGVAVTRAADVASISGSNFSSWYRQDEGTLFADSQRLSLPTASEFPQVFFVSDGTGDNTINLGYITSNVSQFRIRRLASNEANMTPTASTLRRITAGAYAANSAAMSEAGAAALVDTSVVLPSTLTQLNIGTNDGTVSAVNGTIRRLTYWDTQIA